MSSLAMSILAVIAIVIVLRKFDGQPLPNWPYHINLNSFLALFTTIATTGMLVPVVESIAQLKWIWYLPKQRPLSDFQMYDEAYQGGVVGGVKLLKTLKGRFVTTTSNFNIMLMCE